MLNLKAWMAKVTDRLANMIPYTRGSAGGLDWTTTTEGNKYAIMKSALAYWNGAYSGTSSNLQYSANGEILGTSKIKDYITEWGTSGIWVYRKWNSGVSECWGITQLNLTHYTTYDSFYGYNTTVTFPSSLFTGRPAVVYNVQVGGGFAMAASNLGVSQTQAILYALASNSGTQSTAWDIYARGYWK